LWIQKEKMNREDAKGAKNFIYFQIGTDDLKKNHALTGKKMSASFCERRYPEVIMFFLACFAS